MATENDIIKLLSCDTFRLLTTSSTIKIVQLNAVIALLIKLNIPFDIEYSPGTRRLAAAASLTVYITPTLTLSYNFNFEAGGSIFGAPVQS